MSQDNVTKTKIKGIWTAWYEWANASNLNNSPYGSVFFRAVSGYEIMGYFLPLEDSFIRFLQLVYK